MRFLGKFAVAAAAAVSLLAIGTVGADTITVESLNSGTGGDGASTLASPGVGNSFWNYSTRLSDSGELKTELTGSWFTVADILGFVSLGNGTQSEQFIGADDTVWDVTSVAPTLAVPSGSFKATYEGTSTNGGATIDSTAVVVGPLDDLVNIDFIDIYSTRSPVALATWVSQDYNLLGAPEDVTQTQNTPSPNGTSGFGGSTPLPASFPAAMALLSVVGLATIAKRRGVMLA